MQSLIQGQRSALLRLINQLFEAQRKAQNNEAFRTLQRNLERMQEALEEMGLRLHNPLGEAYDESRTDCEATIANTSGKLTVTEVLKPAVYYLDEGKPTLLQKAVVIADAR